jgi:hypothetical protein
MDLPLKQPLVRSLEAVSKPQKRLSNQDLEPGFEITSTRPPRPDGAQGPAALVARIILAPRQDRMSYRLFRRRNARRLGCGSIER